MSFTKEYKKSPKRLGAIFHISTYHGYMKLGIHDLTNKELCVCNEIKLKYCDCVYGNFTPSKCIKNVSP